MQYLIVVELDSDAIHIMANLMATLDEAAAIDLSNPPELTQLVAFMLHTADVWLATRNMPKEEIYAYVNSLTRSPTAITH